MSPPYIFQLPQTCETEKKTGTFFEKARKEHVA